MYGILTARNRRTGKMVRKSWFDSGRGQNFFPPPRLYRPYTGHMLPTIQWVPELLSEASKEGGGVVVVVVVVKCFLCKVILLFLHTSS